MNQSDIKAHLKTLPKIFMRPYKSDAKNVDINQFHAIGLMFLGRTKVTSDIKWVTKTDSKYLSCSSV